MDINGKRYNYIFWDWLWTLYDGTNATLYSWVLPAFERFKDTKHFLVTWTSDSQRRKSQIEGSVVGKYFTEVSVVEGNKEETFKQIIERHSIPISEILVVGDSYTNEITAAKNLGIDWIHVSDFVNRNSPK